MRALAVMLHGFRGKCKTVLKKRISISYGASPLVVYPWRVNTRDLGLRFGLFGANLKSKPRTPVMYPLFDWTRTPKVSVLAELAPSSCLVRMERGLPGSLKGDSEIAGNYQEIPMEVEIPGNMDKRKS